jgi:hypothetical protein
MVENRSYLRAIRELLQNISLPMEAALGRSLQHDLCMRRAPERFSVRRIRWNERYDERKTCTDLAVQTWL